MQKSTVLTACSSVLLAASLGGCANSGLSQDLDSAANTATNTADTAIAKTGSAMASVDREVQALQAGQQNLTTAASTASSQAAAAASGVKTSAQAAAAGAGTLTGALMQQLNVSQAQAQGGAGALLQLAKSRMEAASFNQLTQAVPETKTLLKAAPAVTNASKGLQGLAGDVSALTGVKSNTLTGLSSLVGSFEKLGMSGSMVQQFVPVLVNYVRNSSGTLATKLLTALTGA